MHLIEVSLELSLSMIELCWEISYGFFLELCSFEICYHKDNNATSYFM